MLWRYRRGDGAGIETCNKQLYYNVIMHKRIYGIIGTHRRSTKAKNTLEKVRSKLGPKGKSWIKRW